MKKILLILSFALLPVCQPLYAYTDQITVKADEAWTAVQEVLKNRIQKIDQEKKVLETKWKTDMVRRARGPLKEYMSRTVDRRYRFKVTVTQRDYDSEIEIRGSFQERPHEPNSYVLAWEKVKPETEDFDVERALFMQILNRIELARKGIQEN